MTIGTNSPNATVKSGDLTRDGGTTINGSGSLTVNGKFTFNTASSTTTLADSGVLTVTTRFINRGIFTMTGGTLNVGSTNNGSTITGEYFLAANTNPGSVTQSGGTVNVWINRGFFISDGNALGSSYILSSGSLNVLSNAGYNAGNSTDRALRSVRLGSGSGTGSDLFKITGGTASFSRTTTFVTNVSGGTSDVLISKNSELRVEGGTASFANYSEFRVGFGSGSDGLTPIGSSDNNKITVAGGTLNITGSTPLILGYANDGILNITSGTMTLAGFLQLGNSAVSDADGFVSMTGGSLTIGGSGTYGIVQSGSNSTFTYTGGDLKITGGNYTSLLSQSWFITSGATVTTNYDSVNNWTTFTAVPEPSVCGLALIGLLGLAIATRHRKASTLSAE